MFSSSPSGSSSSSSSSSSSKRQSYGEWKNKVWLSRDDKAPPAEAVMKKESLRTVGEFWGVQDEESKWMDEALNPPPPEETAAQKFVRHKDLQDVLKTIILALHREILPNANGSKPFQFPKSKMTNGGPVPKQYFPDAVWKLEKDYFTAEVQKQAEREYRKKLHESTANATFATPDALRYAFDRHERLSGGRLSKKKKLGPGGVPVGHVKHDEPWRAPDFDPDQINCRTRNLRGTTTRSHYTWAHAEKRAVDNKFKRCEHLLEVMNRERRADIARDVRLLRPDLTNHDKAAIAKERATAADKIMDILLEYKMISITENAGYLMHTLKEYKLEQDTIADDMTMSSTGGGGGGGGGGNAGKSVGGGTVTAQSEIPSFDDASLQAASDNLDFELKAIYSAKYPRKYVNTNIAGSAPRAKNKKKKTSSNSRRKQRKPKPMYHVIKESNGSDRGVIRRPMPTSKSYAAEKILLDLDRRGLHTLPLPPEHRLAGNVRQNKPYSMHFERHFDVWDGYLGEEDPRDQFGLVKKGFRTKLKESGSSASTSTRKSRSEGSSRTLVNANFTNSRGQALLGDGGGGGGAQLARMPKKTHDGAVFSLEQVYQSPHRNGVTGRPRPYHLKGKRVGQTGGPKAKNPVAKIKEYV